VKGSIECREELIPVIFTREAMDSKIWSALERRRTRHAVPNRDQVMFGDYLHAPFESPISYPHLHKLDVLEIGVDQRSHAQLLRPRARFFNGSRIHLVAG
jgi:hypothetical protein